MDFGPLVGGIVACHLSLGWYHSPDMTGKRMITKSMVAAALLVATTAMVSAEAKVRTILHKDNSRTVSSQNVDSQELLEYIYNAKDLVVQKKRFLLDERARPIQGVIFDGGGNLKARVEFGFDDLGRMREERTYDARGRVVRRILYSYNALGVCSAPMAINIDPSGERAPERIAPDRVRPAIANPEFNGGVRVEGDRYFEGELEADRVSVQPRLPDRIRRPLRNR